MLLASPIAVGALLVTWCLLLVWVIKTAEARGRSRLVWGMIGLGAGLLGPAVGLALSARLLEGESTDTVPIAIAFFIPLAALIVPMVAVGGFLLRSPVHVARSGVYKVDVLREGPATLEIERGIKLVIEGGKTITEAQITKVDADGECVRISLGDRDLTVMPLGKPATREGRIHQSLLLAKQLRDAKSLH